MIVLEERVKRRKPLDDCNNRTDWKLISTPLGMSWSYGGSGCSGLKVITTEETEQQKGK
jgi:hypothetical protein